MSSTLAGDKSIRAHAERETDDLRDSFLTSSWKRIERIRDKTNPPKKVVKEKEEQK